MILFCESDTSHDGAVLIRYRTYSLYMFGAYNYLQSTYYLSVANSFIIFTLFVVLSYISVVDGCHSFLFVHVLSETRSG